MTSELTTVAEPVGGHRHKRRSRWLSGKFLAFLLAIATVLGGVTLLTTESQQKASAAVDDGNGFTFPGRLDEMVAFWATKAWPTNKATSSEQDQNGNTPSCIAAATTATGTASSRRTSRPTSPTR
ncbi:hypothetical protein ACFY3G_44080 [Streptomyces phaeochromogenes]|uniref:hypothetical protein n=1 Tax=Streptomyces phaeochromogenes TaxID=1923 RepID=UPI00368CF291